MLQLPWHSFGTRIQDDDDDDFSDFCCFFLDKKMANSTSNPSLAARFASFRRRHQRQHEQDFIPPPRDYYYTVTSSQSNKSSNREVIDYSYTDNPFKLLFWDIFYFFKYAKFLPNIVNPLLPCDSGDMCELALTWGNLHCLFVHSILIVLQLGFLLVVPPMTLLLPLWITALFVASFLVVNQALCLILNGSSGLVFKSKSEFALPDQRPFAHEKWFFLNGVAVGEHWLQNALDRLALTFGRQVTGVHNRTSGIIFDTIECLIQRNFTYATSEIREAHKQIKAALLDVNYSKVVFILHSQGGIEGGLVLDWLLQELPQDLMGKLEVYTFGNAANHFNNPCVSAQALAHVEKRTLLQSTEKEGAIGFAPYEQNRLSGPSKHIEQEKGEASLLSSFLHHQQPPSPPHSPLFNVKPYQQHDQAQGNRSASTPSSNVQAVTRPGSSSGCSCSANNARVVHYIEHYGFTTDFVAVWGVLHFANARPANNTIPKFIGRLFARNDPAHRGGHQFIQHYLDGMFPLERESNGQFSGCKDTNNFIEDEVYLDEEDREGLERYRWGGKEHARNGEQTGSSKADKARVWELSRLWAYRNGRSPQAQDPKLTAGGADGNFKAMMV